jgi:TRAP-type mannitol/chloroaromatic compound transport system permease small subunit
MSSAKVFIRFVDRMNDVIGEAVSYLVVPLTLIVMFEVVMRYVFDAPTLWAWDVNMYLGGLMTILGAAYVHLYKGHVAVEFLLEKWTPKNRALLDLILSPFILVPLVILFWLGWEAAWKSFKIGENWTSLWEPAIWPLRLCIPLGAALFVLQVVSRFLSDLIRYRELTGKEGEN